MKSKRRLLAVLAVFAFVVGILSPFKVNAAGTTYSVKVRKTEGANFNNAGVNVTFYDNAGGLLGTGWYGISADNNYDINVNTNTVPDATASINIQVTSAGQSLSTAIVMINGTNKANAEQLISNEGQTLAMTVADPLELEFVIGNAGGNNQNNDPPVQPGGSDPVEFDITYTGTHIIAMINNKVVVDDQSGEFVYTYKGTIAGAGTNDAQQTNTLTLGAPFGDKPLKEVTINGTKYTSESNGVTVDEESGMLTITVPGAAKYTIVGVADENAVVPRTIIWTNPDYVPKDAEDEEWVSDFKIDHGYAKAIAVYDEEGEPVEIENNGLKDGFGWVEVFPGYEVVFEFVPEYGYQLTGISLNETPMDASDVMNQFTIEIPNDDTAGNVHFAATFTKTADVVKANSKKVDSGSIALGGAFDGGSAQLTVNDVELSSDKVAGFEKAAGDYTISNYLDIDLYNVFYKGKADADDVWSNKISELDKEATITIKLAEGVNANDIVIVHNIHDGEQFEVIEIDSYDAATGTVTFKTKSFSNYAIATKAGAASTSDATTAVTTATTTTAATEAKTSPKTGDAAPITAVMIFAMLGAVGMIVVGSKKRMMK